MSLLSEKPRRILLISYHFAPQNTIGAVRPTKLAKYLTRMGCEVTVICGGGMNTLKDPALEKDLRELKDVHVIEEWNPLRKHSGAKSAKAGSVAPSSYSERRKQSDLKKRIHQGKDLVYRYIRWRSDRCFLRAAKKELLTLKKPYDLVISSYAPLSVHEAACFAKERGIAEKWDADFRDELRIPFGWQKNYEKRYRRMLLQKADYRSAASYGFLEMMGFEKNGFVLSNGYDPEDVPVNAFDRSDGILRLTYCGLLHMGRNGIPDRDLRPIFSTIADMIKNKELQKEKVQLVYAGAEGGLFSQYAGDCELSECVEDHGSVSREEALYLENRSDILLMGSWQSPQQKGILTGKLFEYMMMNKPILCCVGGPMTSGGISHVLSETGIGECWEEGMTATEKDDFAEKVRQLILRIQNGEPPLPNRNDERVASYTYPNLTRLLLEHCDMN